MAEPADPWCTQCDAVRRRATACDDPRISNPNPTLGFHRRMRFRTLGLVGLALAGAGLPVASTLQHRDRYFMAPSASVRQTIDLGRSVRGRRIAAVELGDPMAARKILIVGAVHGDEPAGIAIARRVARGPAPANADLWVVEDLNPDGVAAHTRQNARGVDLNRNFPWRWRRRGHPRDQQYSGPRALSEPEARIAKRLILRLRPEITIWFHQPLGVVDESGGGVVVERRFARLTGLPLRRLTRYRGSAVGWQNRRLPHTTAFVTELPAGSLSKRAASRYARAVLKLIGDPNGPSG
jgi:protein MpaA